MIKRHKPEQRERIEQGAPRVGIFKAAIGCVLGGAKAVHKTRSELSLQATQSDD